MLFFIFLSGHRRKKERVMKVSHFLYFLVLGGVITLSFLNNKALEDKLLIYEKDIEEKSGKISSLIIDLEMEKMKSANVENTNEYISGEYEICLQDIDVIVDEVWEACKELSLKPMPMPYTVPKKTEQFVKTVN